MLTFAIYATAVYSLIYVLQFCSYVFSFVKAKKKKDTTIQTLTEYLSYSRTMQNASTCREIQSSTVTPCLDTVAKLIG